MAVVVAHAVGEGVSSIVVSIGGIGDSGAAAKGNSAVGAIRNAGYHERVVVRVGVIGGDVDQDSRIFRGCRRVVYRGRRPVFAGDELRSSISKTVANLCPGGD